jgi:hypothetical protein
MIIPAFAQENPIIHSPWLAADARVKSIRGDLF